VHSERSFLLEIVEICGNHVSVPWAKAEDIFAPSYTRHGRVRVALALFLAKAVAWQQRASEQDAA